MKFTRQQIPNEFEIKLLNLAYTELHQISRGGHICWSRMLGVKGVSATLEQLRTNFDLLQNYCLNSEVNSWQEEYGRLLSAAKSFDGRIKPSPFSDNKEEHNEYIQLQISLGSWIRTMAYKLKDIISKIESGELIAEKPTGPGQKIEQQEKDEQSETDDIAIEDKELTILVELAEVKDKTYSQIEIEAATNIPRGTIKDKLLRLEKIGLVHRPLGKRKGYQITDKGREIAKRNQ